MKPSTASKLQLCSKSQLALQLVMVKPAIHIQRRGILLRLLIILCVANASSLAAKNPVHANAHANPVLLVHGFQDDAKKMQAMAHALRRDG